MDAGGDLEAEGDAGGMIEFLSAMQAPVKHTTLSPGASQPHYSQSGTDQSLFLAVDWSVVMVLIPKSLCREVA